MLNDKEKRSVEYGIKNMVMKDMATGSSGTPTQSPTGPGATASSNSSNVMERSKKSAIDAFNESIGDCVNTEGGLADDGTEKVSILNDIRAYRQIVSKFNLKHKLNESSSSEFWTNHAENFPVLTKVMKKFLSTPATSVPSESAFSLSAYLGRKERARLTEENLATSVFLKDKIAD